MNGLDNLFLRGEDILERIDHLKIKNLVKGKERGNIIIWYKIYNIISFSGVDSLQLQIYNKIIKEMITLTSMEK